MSDINRRRALGLGVIAVGGAGHAGGPVRAERAAPQYQQFHHAALAGSFRYARQGRHRRRHQVPRPAFLEWGRGDLSVYPTLVPISDALTKRGHTEIVRKKEGPGWTSTASQMERFPDWKPVAGGDPANPLGSHAMYLPWPASLIHGTHDTRKIGRLPRTAASALQREDCRAVRALPGRHAGADHLNQGAAGHFRRSET